MTPVNPNQADEAATVQFRAVGPAPVGPPPRQGAAPQAGPGAQSAPPRPQGGPVAQGKPVPPPQGPQGGRAQVPPPAASAAAVPAGNPAGSATGSAAGFASGSAAGAAAVPVPPAGGPPRLTRRRTAILAAVVAGVLLAAGGGVLAWATAGDVPRGTEVLGIDLGAQTRSEAEATLTRALGDRLTAPARVTLAGKQVELKAADIGLALDTAATVDAAAGGGPRLWGTRTVEPVVTVDQGKLEAALRKNLDPDQVTMKKPGITFAGTTPKPRYPEPGRDIDPAQAAQLVRAGWLGGGPVEVPLVERPPATTREQVDQLVADVAAPAVAAPVAIRTEGGVATLTPAAIAKGLVFRADDAGKLTPAIDAKKLRAAAAKELAKVEVEPESANIALSGGKPRIVASTPGKQIDLAKLDLLAVLPNAAPRELTAALETTEAATTDADMVQLGIKEKVSTFTTKFDPGQASRSSNIKTIAREVDGAIVKPGETFSLNGHTGERSYAQGYKDAPVIVGGKLEPGVGGGASQFTTTLFNAAYYAGLQDVEHKPHSFYFSRYPSVIESTIFYPTLDLKFKNTTEYGVLIDTSYTSNSITVAMWSTKVYDSVKTVYGPRRNHTSPPTVHREDGPKCIATSGLPGFTQDAWRVIRKDGQELPREKFTWKYDPEPRFICGGTEDED
ncbi:VanW family protein [Spirilliplanes yamanashiensis]|uniref:Vanomycin resistance protein VanB n=1 Tax=Spirilliplanes yamanashiensis TaxID=42233 RepID=A0A8J3Y3F5_9ACTN|nr:VanW family protein [Spirilliplanes yamanashiensis]MDP9814057.1 vancomycin resistance protein YoaR [Spirilliplanes yamanashiensis]GIJ00963.1 vanomycin resistance protein VanB [Spirilliplanes yamanashiensis]